jgi:hypothetical protein
MGTGEVIYKGIHLVSRDCKYFYVKEGNTTSWIQDRPTSTATLEYKAGSDSKTVAGILGLPHIGKSQPLVSMGRPQKFPDITVSLDGLKFKKLTYDPHIIKIIIVSDSESRVVQNYSGTTIVVSQDDYKNPDFIDYLVYRSPGLLYLRPVTPKSCKPSDWHFRNYPKIIVSQTSLDLQSGSEVVYALRNKYDQYLIRSVDYQEQFFLEIGEILKSYGIELARYNREKTLQNTSYISYRIGQTPSKSSHPYIADLDSGVLSHRVPIDFEFRTPNMQMFYDFKNKFNNVDLLSNFCEFKTTDRYGSRWTASVKWGRIGEDFSHMYEADGNSNFSFQCQFQCELYFYEVYDKAYEFTKEILLDLSGTDIEGQGEVKL